jgi:DNA-binding MarR family transcriptional regulator
MLYENDPFGVMFYLISGIHIKSRHWTEKQLKPLRVTWPQFGAMIALSQNEGITQKELSRIIETDTTTIMVICDSLEKRGLVNRVRDESDRRINRLFFTDEGKDVLGKAVQKTQLAYKHILANISPDEIKESLPLLQKIYSRVKEVHEKEVMEV